MARFSSTRVAAILELEVNGIIEGFKRVELDTPHGPAAAYLDRLTRPKAALVLGHGAGGGVTSPDLLCVAEVARAEAVTAVLVEQPYRVAGRRAPAPAHQLDAAWREVIARLAANELDGLSLVVGGRSLGARVACRTAEATGAVAVLCLAFPLQPPASRRGRQADSRICELDAVAVPTLVVQGKNDRFGMPPQTKLRRVVQVPGDHSLKADLGAVAAAVSAWMPAALGSFADTAESGFA